MAEKTIPDLAFTTDLDDNSLFVVDSGTQTFKVNGENLALFIRESVLPAGLTAPFAGSVAPAGWLLCDGSAVSRTTYAKLFAAIGTAYGIGNGTSTFNVPDLRGRIIAGKDNMGGTAASRLTVAVAGFDATLLGAVGGSQDYTPAGINGGSQSIAHTHTGPSHTHTMAHTHNFAHTHASFRIGATAGSGWWFNASETASNSVTSFPGATDVGQTFLRGALNVDPGASNNTRFYAQPMDASFDAYDLTNIGSRYAYTTGALSAPSGSGSTATTGAASTSTTSSSGTGVTGGMSTNATVNGSNFSFTGTASHRVQPTMIMNQIIKT